MSFLGGNVPFSWEDLPGVSKFNTEKYTTITNNTGVHDLVLPPKPTPVQSSHYEMIGEQKKIPPPPPFSFHEPPRRSFSKRFLWKMEEEDPFLEALKECTKSSVVNDHIGSKFMKIPTGYDSKNKSFGICGISMSSFFPKLKKSKSILSCKGSFDVEENNLVMPSSSNRLPIPIPRERFQGLIKLQERLKNWK